MDVLIKLFEQRFHRPVMRVQPLQGQLSGSGRRIIRLLGESVTEIYADDLDRGAYLEEDFGDTTLFDFLAANRHGAEIAPAALEIYRTALAVLPRFQIEAAHDLNYKVCY